MKIEVLVNKLIGLSKVLTKIYVSLVGHLNDMMADSCLSVEFLKLCHLHICNGDNKLDSQGFQLFQVFSSSKVAYVQASFPPLSGPKYAVYFSVYNHLKNYKSPLLPHLNYERYVSTQCPLLISMRGYSNGGSNIENERYNRYFPLTSSLIPNKILRIKYFISTTINQNIISEVIFKLDH